MQLGTFTGCVGTLWAISSRLVLQWLYFITDKARLHTLTLPKALSKRYVVTATYERDNKINGDYGHISIYPVTNNETITFNNEAYAIANIYFIILGV